MACHPHHGPFVDDDSDDALNLALATLADCRAGYHWGDPRQHISYLTSLILEALAQITVKIEQALEDGHSWDQIRDELGIPHPYGRR
jgi:hypothetical protein